MSPPLPGARRLTPADPLPAADATTAVAAAALSQRLQIVNRKGLHARAAAKLASTINRYQADVRVCRQDLDVCGRSIMGLMMLAASQGTEVQVTATGSDAPAVMAAIVALIQDRFGEE